MKSGTFWVGILGGVIVSFLIGFFLLPLTGIFPTTATGKPNLLDWWGHTNLESSVAWHSPDASIPADANLAEGFEHYRSMCLHCHGAPNADREEWAHHMLPKPPELWEEDTQNEEDGELFYIVSNGIRMTGMPAFGPIHSEKDIWNMVAFLRQLNNLSEEQKQTLQTTSREFSR
jgi:mono/diheme cytochrome c family protein